MEDEFQSGREDCSEFDNDNQNNTEEESDPDNQPRRLVNKRKRNSFVWNYFGPIEGSSSHKCSICKAVIGNQTSNLTRHLAVVHNIRKIPENNSEPEVRGRGRYSFIWKYCIRESDKYARCQLCYKLLYFGGGNTGNISKHLHRRHPRAVGSKEQVQQLISNMEETSETVAENHDTESLNDGHGDSNGDKNMMFSMKSELRRRERKGGSYVWNYCDKLSRHTIRCRLCSKVMSFHGTANVITHLQRKHNIVGKIDSDNNIYMESTNFDLNLSEENSMADDADQLEAKRRGRSTMNMSIVWKYCTRLGKDVVRCGFCKKNLSYQGTSNLQRHLHRMHGIATQGRLMHMNDSAQYGTDGGGDTVANPLLSGDMIWDYCSPHTDSGDKIKCNMCNALYDRNEVDDIVKHLTMVHSISPRRKSKRQRKTRRPDSVDDTNDDEYESENDNWSKEDLDRNVEFDATNIKKDTADSFYDDLIEEDQTNYDEDPFDPNATNEVPIANPLSPQTSRGNSPENQHNKFYANTRQMQKLNEERVRMETEYFREKAGFYRMQKYLTALQAKKLRAELEPVNSADISETYTVDVNGIQQLVTQ